jgi:probable rRNA maturation factor
MEPPVSRRIFIRATRSERRQAAWVRRRLARFLDKLLLEQVELSVWLCRDAEIRRLNRHYRGIDQTTDVLSFPAAQGPAPGSNRLRRNLGDLAISLQTARRAAREEGRPLREELDRYLAHGLLHLLGHDHEKVRPARRMARAEQDLLGARGMVE